MAPRRSERLGFGGVAPTPDERAASMPGDALVEPADVVMDRAFTVPASPEQTWPWLAQLGKRRAGWYFPRAVERVVPASRRGLRHLEPRWQELGVGDVIPDWGGRDATFTVAEIAPPEVLVYSSRRGRTDVSWAFRLSPSGRAGTRVQLRLRLGPVRHPVLASSAGGFFDLLTIAGLAAGLRERVVVRR